MSEWWDGLSREQKEQLAARSPELAEELRREDEFQELQDAMTPSVEEYELRVAEVKAKLHKDPWYFLSCFLAFFLGLMHIR